MKTTTIPKLNREKLNVLFTLDDTTELYFIIRSRGHSRTRDKLLTALTALDRDLAVRIHEQDQAACEANQ